MLKKNVWVAGLLAALAIMFAGCVDEYKDPGASSGEMTVVFDLQAALKDAPVGKIANQAAFIDIFGDTPLVVCGSDQQYEIINVAGGKKALQSSPTASWGEGFDVDSAKAKFRSGDTVYIKGTSSKAGLILNTGGESGNAPRLGNWISPAGAFEETFTVSASEGAALKNPKGMRVQFRDGAEGGRTGVFVFEEFKITGLRGGSAFECSCLDPKCPCKTQPWLMSDDCGPQCEFCTPDKFPGSGSWTDYEVPVSTNPNEFYLNIANFTSDTLRNGPQASEGVPTAAYSKNSVKFYYDRNDQRVNFVINDTAQRAMLIEAINASEPIQVEVDGTSSLDAQFRYMLINPTTGADYNATNYPRGKLSEILKGSLARSRAATHDNTGALTLQIEQGAMPGPWRGVIVEIKSIKIIVPAKNKAITLRDIPITAPALGAIAQTTLTTAQFKGDITWTPALGDGGNFAITPNTPYTATVKLTANNAYWTFVGVSPSAQFTAGSLNGKDFKITALNTAEVIFAFPALTTAEFPVGTDIKPQKPNPATNPAPNDPALVDLTDEVTNPNGTGGPDNIKDVLVGAQLTATYTGVAGGPAESQLSYQWQQKNDSNKWETKGTGKTFTPGMGIWRILITTSFQAKISNEFLVYFKPNPTKTINVKFGTGTGQTEAKHQSSGTTTQATITFDNDSYTYTYGTGNNANYGNALVRFKVDLGTASLGDYKEIKFKWTGITGDAISSKKLYLLASATEAGVTSWKSDDAIKGMIVSNDPGPGFWDGSGFTVNGTSEIAVTLPINKEFALNGEVWFSIYSHATGGAQTIGAVEFVPVTPITP